MSDSEQWPIERAATVPYTARIKPPIELKRRPPELADDDRLRALADELTGPPPAMTALRTTAQCIFDLRFHQLVELCARTIEKNADKLKAEPYDLATGLSGWAIETLAKTDP
jgi:hypothetical protein